MTTQNQSFMTSTREELPRRRPLAAAFFGLGMGFFSLATGLNRPTIANMRTIDLVHLLATGGAWAWAWCGWSCTSSGAVTVRRNVHELLATKVRRNAGRWRARR